MIDSQEPEKTPEKYRKQSHATYGTMILKNIRFDLVFAAETVVYR